MRQPRMIIRSVLISHVFVLPLLLSLKAPGNVLPIQDAASLQNQAIQRIERCVVQIRKTGNVQSVLGEMQTAEDELTRSYQEFLRRQDNASAALSLHKMADIQRLQFRWQEANGLYRQAYELARKANHTAYQIKPLIGQARVAYQGSKDRNAAISYLDEAIRLSMQTVEKRDLFDVYDLKSAVLSSRNETAAAFDYASRAFSIAVETNDPELLFYGYFSRGGVYERLGMGCDDKSAAQVCIEALDHAKNDLEQSLVLAKRNGYDFFVQPLTQLLSGIRGKRMLLELSDSHSKTMSGIDIFSPIRPNDVIVNERFVDDPRPLQLVITQIFSV